MTLQTYIDTIKRQKSNDNLLAKLSDGEIAIPNQLFKRKLLNN
jgi:hypothetical protein